MRAARTVLFDLDDTLLDDSGPVVACWDAACARAASAGVDPLVLVGAVHAARAWFWSDPARHARERVDMLAAWRKIVERALDALGRPSPGLAAAIAEDFAARRRAAAALFPDALPCLERLRAAGVALGLVTNGDARVQRDKLARHDLARFFDVIAIEGEVGVGKPDPAVFQHALAAVGADPRDATMVGNDLVYDVAGAAGAGITTVWVDRDGRGHAPDVDVRPARIVRSLTELTS